MTLADMIHIALSRVAYLNALRETAIRLGDAAQIASIDRDIADTQATLNTLQSAQTQQ